MPDGEHEVTKRKRILRIDLSLRGCQKKMHHIKGFASLDQCSFPQKSHNSPAKFRSFDPFRLIQLSITSDTEFPSDWFLVVHAIIPVAQTSHYSCIAV
jgi:hypothetical protein